MEVVDRISKHASDVSGRKTNLESRLQLGFQAWLDPDPAVLCKIEPSGLLKGQNYYCLVVGVSEWQ